MESILSFSFIICKTNSQGGPRHAFGGMISLIAVAYKFSQRVDTGFLRTSGQWSSPLLSLSRDYFTTKGKEASEPSKAVRFGMASVFSLILKSSHVIFLSDSCSYIYIDTYKHVHTHANINVCTCTCIYIHICTHVDLHMWNFVVTLMQHACTS